MDYATQLKAWKPGTSSADLSSGKSGSFQGKEYPSSVETAAE